MKIIFINSDESEAIDNKDILYEDQIQYINGYIDLKIIDSDTNKLMGFVISQTPIFILSKGFDSYLKEIFFAFLEYKSIQQMLIYYRGDTYPVDLDRDYIYTLNDYDQEQYLLEKRIEYEQKYGITPSDISALYSLASSNNEQAIAVLGWLNNIRNLYYIKIADLNDAKYYDYDYSSCGDIPYSLNDIFKKNPAPTKPTQIKYLYAINETWQSHYKSKELIILWDDFVKKDNIYEMKKSVNDEKMGYDIIKISGYNGYIKISYKINIMNEEYNRIELMSLLSKNWEEVTDSIAYAYSRSRNFIRYASSVCSPIIMNVKDGDELRLHTRISYNSTKFGYTKKVSTIWRQSNILIETI